MPPVTQAITTLDTSGLLCPLPVLKAQKALKALKPGDILRMIATDPAAAIDVPHFCCESGHALVAQTPVEGGLQFDIKKV